MKKTSSGKILLGCAIAACAVFLASVALFIVGIVKSGERMDIGFDPSSRNVIKMTVGEEGERIAACRDGALFAYNEEGELLWDVGAPNSSPVYDLAEREGKVYAVYADGTVYVFETADAKRYTQQHTAEPPEEGAAEETAEETAEESFAPECTVYRLEASLGGDVTNTQLVVGDGVFYLRAKLNDIGGHNALYRFEEGGSAVEVRRPTSFTIGGVALAGENFYYAYRGDLYCNEEEILSLDDDIVALTATEDEVAMLTTANALIVSDEEGNIVGQTDLKLRVENAFPAGESFLIKIKNGGIAVVSVAERKVTLSMPSGDGANFILWDRDCFALRDDSNVSRPVFSYYSLELAGSRALWSTLRWVFLGVALAALAAGIVCGLSVSPAGRRKLQTGAKNLAKAAWKDKTIYLALLVPFALLITFYYVPIVLGFSISFLDYIPGERSVFVGFRYFGDVLRGSAFWEATGTMVVFLITDLLKALIPPFILAELIIAARNKRFSLWVRILLFLPGILPGVATALIWSAGFFSPTTNGLVNAFIKLFMPSFVGINWVNNASLAVRILTVICFGFPWVGSYLIFFGALGGINVSVFEAAKLDGCSWIRRVFAIDIPMILAQFKYVLITSFIASVQNYGTLFILYGDQGITAAVKTPALLMYVEIMGGHYSIASVWGVFLFLVLAVVTVLNFRSQREQIE